jgi:hypothetical protein
MPSSRRFPSPGAVVRAALAIATVVFAAAGLLVREPKVMAAAAAFGVLWTVWDVLADRVVGPALDWAGRILTEGGAAHAPPDIRPTLDDTIRLLESHLEGGASRGVQIQAAIRLEEIYRTIRKDPSRARAVIERVGERFPDAKELALYRRGGTA